MESEEMVEENLRDIYDNISPIDYRYWRKEVGWYLSENGFTRYKLEVEASLANAVHRRGMCGLDILKEIEKACEQVTTAEVYIEEGKTKHDIRALVNCIQKRVSERARSVVHFTATSFDIVETANAARYRDVTMEVLLPSLIKLEEVLIILAKREAETLQIGRTHGQHAVPITFGFAIAEYVSRLGESILFLRRRANELVGKFSGASGAYNASSLFFSDPEIFEREVLSELRIKPGEYSTQIVMPEKLVRFFIEMILIGGILANLSRDMRNLQRTEIGEVGELFEENQVGSSTMPQKRNPINFENVESVWKILVGRVITLLLDQISEHQRDLTNSASARTLGEVIGYLVSITERLTKTMKKLQVDKVNLERNFNLQKGLIVAEPLYLILAALGHPDAHEKVRTLTLQSQKEHKNLEEIAMADPELKVYLSRMDSLQKRIISNPSEYVGIAPKKAMKVASNWNRKINSLKRKMAKAKK
ncbi:MAG: lyase family protein [Candidatus Nealsonbacteria bacterium]|nr:lyase family protein [Candidatus Nealsonbacteria bacterium]